MTNRSTNSAIASKTRLERSGTGDKYQSNETGAPTPPLQHPDRGNLHLLCQLMSPEPWSPDYGLSTYILISNLVFQVVRLNKYFHAMVATTTRWIDTTQ